MYVTHIYICISNYIITYTYMYGLRPTQRRPKTQHHLLNTNPKQNMVPLRNSITPETHFLLQ